MPINKSVCWKKYVFCWHRGQEPDVCKQYLLWEWAGSKRSFVRKLFRRLWTFPWTQGYYKVRPLTLIAKHWLTCNILDACMRVHVQLLCRVWLFATLWKVARQDPLSLGFSKQEYSSVLVFPSPGIFLTQGSISCIHSASLGSKFFTTVPPGKPYILGKLSKLSSCTIISNQLLTMSKAFSHLCSPSHCSDSVSCLSPESPW